MFKSAHVVVCSRTFLPQGNTAERSVIYWQTHLKLLLLISSEAPAGNCCMLIVIILQPPPDSFDLCSKCVFNKSARGEGRKEEQQKDIRGEMRWESRHDRMRCWLSVVVEDKSHFSFLFYPTKHWTEKKKKKNSLSNSGSRLSHHGCLLSETKLIPLIQSNSRVVIRVLYVA